MAVTTDPLKTGLADLLNPSFTSVTVSGLTAGRVVYTGTGGLLTTSDGLAYTAGNGVTLTGANDTNFVIAQTVRTSGSTALGYLGVEGSTPGSFNADSLSYATILASAASGRALQFGTAGTIRASILSDGSFLIGQTTNPSGYKLAVTGNVGVESVAPTLVLKTEGPNNFSSLNLGDNGSITYIQTTYSGSGPVHDLALYYDAQERIRLHSAGTAVTGNVGVTGIQAITANSASAALTVTQSGAGPVLNLTGLPTSAAGLSAGDVWNDGGTLKVA